WNRERNDSRSEAGDGPAGIHWRLARALWHANARSASGRARRRRSREPRNGHLERSRSRRAGAADAWYEPTGHASRGEHSRQSGYPHPRRSLEYSAGHMSDSRRLFEEVAVPRRTGSTANGRVRAALTRELKRRGFVILEQQFPVHPPGRLAG